MGLTKPGNYQWRISERKMGRCLITSCRSFQVNYNKTILFNFVFIFRQFGFKADAANYAAGADVYYHCFVKVCDKANKATCSTTTVNYFLLTRSIQIYVNQVTGDAVSCSNSVYTAPSRKRRFSGNDMLKQMDLATNKLNVNVITDCPKGEFCLQGKRTAKSTEAPVNQSSTKTDINSSALNAMSTCAAITLLTMLY